MDKLIDKIKLILNEDLSEAISNNYAPEKGANDYDNIDDRINRVIEAAELASQAAKDAKAQGNEEQAEEMNELADQLNRWIGNKKKSNSIGKQSASKADSDTNGSAGKSDGASDKDGKDGKDKDSDQKDEQGDSEGNGTGESDDEDDQKDGQGSKANSQKNKDNTDQDAGEGDGESESSNSDDQQKDNKNSGKGTGNGQDNNDSDDDNEDDNDDDDSIENPFNVNPKNAQSKAGKMKKPKEQTKAEKLAAISQILRSLTGGEKDGAHQAIKDLLNKTKTESLCEAIELPGNFGELSDDEFEGFINSVYDKINAVKPIQYTDPERVKQRSAKVTSILNDPFTKRELNQEDQQNGNGQGGIDKYYKNKNKEIARYQEVRSNNLDVFKSHVERLIGKQIKKIEHEDDSWAVLNRRHGGDIDTVIQPGIMMYDEIQKVMPMLVVYMDCSGSFNYSDIQKERDTLGILKSYVDRHELTVNLNYFADNVHTTFDAARAEGGTSAWPKIMESIESLEAKLGSNQNLNIAIITDSDMNGTASYLDKMKQVSGCVWYIWKKSDAPNLPKYLHGRQGTYEFWME